MSGYDVVVIGGSAAGLTAGGFKPGVFTTLGISSRGDLAQLDLGLSRACQLTR